MLNVNNDEVMTTWRGKPTAISIHASTFVLGLTPPGRTKDSLAQLLVHITSCHFGVERINLGCKSTFLLWVRCGFIDMLVFIYLLFFYALKFDWGKWFKSILYSAISCRLPRTDWMENWQFPEVAIVFDLTISICKWTSPVIMIFLTRLPHSCPISCWLCHVGFVSLHRLLRNGQPVSLLEIDLFLDRKWFPLLLESRL